MRNSVESQSLLYYKVGTYDGKSNDELLQMIEDLAAKIGLLEMRTHTQINNHNLTIRLLNRKDTILYLY